MPAAQPLPTPSERSEVSSAPMALGKRVRLARLFAHPSRRLCSVAVDHWFGYRARGAAVDLVDLPRTLAALVPARPSGVTMSRARRWAAGDPTPARCR